MNIAHITILVFILYLHEQNIKYRNQSTLVAIITSYHIILIVVLGSARFSSLFTFDINIFWYSLVSKWIALYMATEANAESTNWRIRTAFHPNPEDTKPNIGPTREVVVLISAQTCYETTKLIRKNTTTLWQFYEATFNNPSNTWNPIY